MALYEKTTATTVDEDDIDRSIRIYQAKKDDGTTVVRCTVTVPGAVTFDGLLVDALSAADRTAFAGIAVRLVRRVLTDQGMTVKP